MKKSLTYVIIFTCICLLTLLDILMGILAMIIWLTGEVVDVIEEKQAKRRGEK